MTTSNDNNRNDTQDLECPDRVLIGGEESDEGREAIQALVEVIVSINIIIIQTIIMMMIILIMLTMLMLTTVQVYSKWVPADRIITMNTWSRFGSLSSPSSSSLTSL